MFYSPVLGLVFSGLISGFELNLVSWQIYVFKNSLNSVLLASKFKIYLIGFLNLTQSIFFRYNWILVMVCFKFVYIFSSVWFMNWLTPPN